jgi:hypothetical protein
VAKDIHALIPTANAHRRLIRANDADGVTAFCSHLVRPGPQASEGMRPAGRSADSITVTKVLHLLKKSLFRN